LGEFEDRINSLLSSPEEMSKIMQMAKMFMPEGDEPKVAQEQSGDLEYVKAADSKESMPGGAADSGMADLLGRVLNSGVKKDRRHALLAAMMPYLAGERQKKLERAMQLAQIASMAGMFFAEGGGVEDV